MHKKETKMTPTPSSHTEDNRNTSWGCCRVGEGHFRQNVQEILKSKFKGNSFHTAGDWMSYTLDSEEFCRNGSPLPPQAHMEGEAPLQRSKLCRQKPRTVQQANTLYLTQAVLRASFHRNLIT